MNTNIRRHVWTSGIEPRAAQRLEEHCTRDQGPLLGLVLTLLWTIRAGADSGSVDEYVVNTATLRLKHNYPAAPSATVANVDIVHVLERIKSQEMEVGAWINVIGYVERRQEHGVFVQAIAVWSADNVDLSAYEKAVDARKAAG